MTEKFVVYIAGERWDGVAGTDRRLVTALARTVPVLWVDPPLSIVRKGAGAVRPLTLEQGRIVRLQTLAPPAVSRRVMRPLIDVLMARSIRNALSLIGADVGGVVVASPRARFPRGVAGTRFLYVTDDWQAGAGLMGLSLRSVSETLQRNLSEADEVAAVTPELASRLRALAPGKPVAVLANGCEPVASVERSEPAPPVAGLVGQLNERLDLDMLEAVRAHGTPILVIGPRTDRDPDVGARLDRFLAADNVTWLGQVPFAALSDHLATVGVGLTPYADTPFNRSSFPLKTLEYLAHGLPVVSTDLPAVRWLGTELIEVANSPEAFAFRVAAALQPPASETEAIARRSRRREFARSHSWDERADRLLEIIGGDWPTGSTSAAHLRTMLR